MSTTLTTEDCAPCVAQQRACQEPVQEQHLESLCGQLHSLHCGYTSLEHNRKVHHSVDELNLGHLQVKALHGHRDVHNRRRAPGSRRPPRRPPPFPPQPPRPGHRPSPLPVLDGGALQRAGPTAYVGLTWGTGTPSAVTTAASTGQARRRSP